MADLNKALSNPKVNDGSQRKRIKLSQISIFTQHPWSRCQHRPNTASNVQGWLWFPCCRRTDRRISPRYSFTACWFNAEHVARHGATSHASEYAPHRRHASAAQAAGRGRATDPAAAYLGESAGPADLATSITGAIMFYIPSPGFISSGPNTLPMVSTQHMSQHSPLPAFRHQDLQSTPTPPHLDVSHQMVAPQQ